MLLYNVQLLCYYVTLSLKSYSVSNSYSVSRRYFCYSVTLSQIVTLSLRRCKGTSFLPLFKAKSLKIAQKSAKRAHFGLFVQCFAYRVVEKQAAQIAALSAALRKLK